MLSSNNLNNLPQKKTGLSNLVPHFLAKQASNPEGIIGKWFGMAMKKMNREPNEWLISLLNVKSDEKLLEVGFGPGDGINLLSNIVSNGLIAGVDCSRTMYESAVQKNKLKIEQGLVELTLGHADKLHYADDFFDKVFCTHVIYFWKSPLVELTELYRVTQAGGKIAIFIGDNLEMSKIKLTQTGIYNLYHHSEVEELLRSVGYTNVSSFFKKIANGPIETGVCVLAEKPIS